MKDRCVEDLAVEPFVVNRRMVDCDGRFRMKYRVNAGQAEGEIGQYDERKVTFGFESIDFMQTNSKFFNGEVVAITDSKSKRLH